MTPPTIGRKQCPNCGRSISPKSQSLVDDDGCPFCRQGGDSDE